MAARYLAVPVTPENLKRGDIITGFHLEPVSVVESAPVPHPTREGWWTLEKATRYGVGQYVLTEGETESVGRVPLVDVGHSFGIWLAPCGCAVSAEDHCEKCGPYNRHSPKYGEETNAGV